MFSLQGTCVTVAALMQYFLMVAFCWMLVEGIYLYLFVVKVYNINNKMNIYYVMSLGKVLCNELFYCYLALRLTLWINWSLDLCRRKMLLFFLFFCFPLFTMYCRFSCCYGCNLAEYCYRERRNPEFCQWGIVRITFLYVSSSLPSLNHQVARIIITQSMEKDS